MIGLAGLRDAAIEGALEQVRPKTRTVTAIMAGRLPILWSTWSTGTGFMQGTAVPMAGGKVPSTVPTLLTLLATHSLMKVWPAPRAEAATQEAKAFAAAEQRPVPAWAREQVVGPKKRNSCQHLNHVF